MAVDNYLKYYKVSVHPDKVCVTPSFEGLRSSHRTIMESVNDSDEVIKEEPRKVQFSVNNELSRITKSKINKAITYINRISQDKQYIDRYSQRLVNYKLTFATLTLSSSQVHTDNEIKGKLLNQFFIEAKNRWNVTHYVWRGEKQLNGSIHFHIVTSCFIPYQELNEVWNRIQNKLGYVDRYSEKMQKLSYYEYRNLFKNNKKYTEALIRKSWIKGRSTNWKYPNSTDIHALQFIKDITAYICKYMKKSEQMKGQEGRLWSCSHSLSNLQGGRDIVSGSISNELNLIGNCVGVRKFSDDFFDLFYIDESKLLELGCFELLDLLHDFLNTHFSSS